MAWIIIITAVLTIISFVFDRKKTIRGIKKGLLQFLKILPTLLMVIIIISIVLHFVSNELLRQYLGESAGLGAYISAAVIGSVIAVFITTLMIVGILTIPIEARYFGLKTTLIRNGLSFIGAIVVGAAMVFVYSIT
jgi:uncharacterized membrane protein YraQ (UPF0718 family)